MRYPQTPDGRYFVVNGQLWRCSNPALEPDARQTLVDDLMHARADVKRAKQTKDQSLEKDARSRVHTAKVALGERGPVWWNDGSPDYNRHKTEKTPYADWYHTLEPGADRKGKPGDD